VFENYVPEKDSFPGPFGLKGKPGPIIIGKAQPVRNSPTRASTSGRAGLRNRSWNAFDPSKALDRIRGGGSAVSGGRPTWAAAGALGTQTGDSLWGDRPVRASLVFPPVGRTGLTTCPGGSCPLTYIQDYCGVITRTLEDQALVLNTIAVPDHRRCHPEPPGLPAGKAKRPTDLGPPTSSPDALEGKTIGYYDLEFTSPLGRRRHHEREMKEGVQILRTRGCHR